MALPVELLLAVALFVSGYWLLLRPAVVEGVAVMVGAATLVRLSSTFETQSSLAARRSLARGVRGWSLAAAMLGVPIVALGLVPAPSTATSVVRGGTAFETAVLVSQRAFDTAPVAVVVPRAATADLAVGAAHAAWLRAPLLVTAETDASEAVLAEIERLAATRAVVVGNHPVLGESLRRAGLDVTLEAGATAAATSLRVAVRVRAPRVVIAATDTPVHMAAAASYAAATRRPLIVMAAGGAESVADELWRIGTSEATIITTGRRSALTRATRGVGIRVHEIVRADGYRASRVVAQQLRRSGLDEAWVAPAASMPDVAAAGAAAAATGGFVVPVAGGRRDVTRKWLAARSNDFASLVRVGAVTEVARTP